jgi:hypothetical protein
MDANYCGIPGVNTDMRDAAAKVGPQLQWLFSTGGNAYSNPESAIAVNSTEKCEPCLPTERYLQPWEETCDTPSTQLIMTPLSLSADLEDMSDASGAWDQFEVNRSRFGVKSTFCEDLSQYTTTLDLSGVPLDVQQKACQIAEEIEKEQKVGIDSDGYQVAIDDANDEESKFSSVTRKLEQFQ